MPVLHDEYHGVRVFTVRGDLADAEAEAIRQAIEREPARPNMIFDLEGCRFLGSLGLQALLQALHRCESLGGRAMLSGLDPNCRKILEITRLDHRFECHPELASALKGME